MSERKYMITKEELDKYIKYFDEQERDKEYALNRLFSKYRTNTSLYEIMLKVTVLNSFYSAGLNNSKGKTTMDVVTMAKHILMEPRFDIWLYSENSEDQLKAYNYIAEEPSIVRNINYNKCYSFASKYCSWHNPEVFPIMDKNAKKTLNEIINSDDNHFKNSTTYRKSINSDDFHDYMVFRELCLDFMHYVNNECGFENKYTLKDIDKYLWIYEKIDNIETEESQEIKGGEYINEEAKTT